MTSSESGALRKQAAPIAKALNTIASKTKRPFSMQSQPGRFRIQKTTYLLRHSGYPAAKRYSFNIYHMGPYSPDLARAYYELEDDGIRAAGAATDIPTETLELLSEALEKPDAFLEGLTTLLDIWTQSRSLPTALPQAKSMKPHLDDTTWKEVRRFLTAHPALTTIT
jgi:uncharacterized protein YwgA